MYYLYIIFTHYFIYWFFFRIIVFCNSFIRVFFFNFHNNIVFIKFFIFEFIFFNCFWILNRFWYCCLQIYRYCYFFIIRWNLLIYILSQCIIQFTIRKIIIKINFHDFNFFRFLCFSLSIFDFKFSNAIFKLFK